MDNADNLFHPSLAAALMKLDPDDGEQIMEYFKTHALLSREKALLQTSVRDQKKLLVENAKLKKDIEQLRNQLQDKQRRRTAKALLSPAPPPPSLSSTSTTPVNQPASPAEALAAVPTNPHPPSTFSQDRRDRQSRRRRGEKKARPSSDLLSLGAEPRVDVSRLDLRVGRILSVRRHPLAETMSIQEVDVGENAPRTVVSKLGGKIQLEELQGGLVVLLCNVKACKMRGVASQARLLCCSTSDDCIELLAAPTGSTPGDRVTFLNYPGDPDRELPSKQRVWELLQPDLQVDSRGVANYKGCGFEVKGKGLCRAPSLTNCIIR
ncbi:aminoacyl tRNA synthase complex-interacting multifunctional protein 1-like [Seriola lalandi dorsalis]|uniref:Aminoacyl tRNA synthetase complex interacting multifunctional protein 1b n=1 Tax=Seriola lalandi dorsalis TaxID=1841481 RepID=A0A3B4WT16_SERLL|nr:aminoacyl tRNA synthase complex-interacting multifunctional protein 1-like [Seriola lalandi dorsalis]